MNYQIEEPLSLWSEIIPNRLWVGGTDDLDIVNIPKNLPNFGEAKMFDVVISLYAHSQPVGWQVKELRYGFPDGPLSPEDGKELDRIADWAFSEYLAGGKIGIRCQLGINRSAYLCGKLLIKLGYQPSEAIALIRERRSPYALNNKYFEKALLAG
jgi:hypothetical protein